MLVIVFCYMCVCKVMCVLLHLCVQGYVHFVAYTRSCMFVLCSTHIRVSIPAATEEALGADLHLRSSLLLASTERQIKGHKIKSLSSD
jgi:hypothetical protein